MFEHVLLRWQQRGEVIKDPSKATIALPFRGFPILQQISCGQCQICQEICPTYAIQLSPLQIDLGKCTFCGECADNCPHNKIQFTNEHRIACHKRNDLLLQEGMSYLEYEQREFALSEKIKKILGRSLRLRQVSAGGCNGCEMELNACSNINFDMSRYGIEFVASPRHADGIVITGPISANMSQAVWDAYHAVPSPKIVVLAGTCAISGGLFASSPAVNREFIERVPIDLYIPGCPCHPLTVMDGLLRLLGRLK